jgi:CPA2 family monovalent cation:H+ antiporter-2
LLLGDFVALAVVFAFAFLGGHLAQRSRQSMVVGYIVAGVALGTIGAAWVPLGKSLFVDIGIRQVSRSVQAVFDFGITFLMFFTGMEISIHRLSRAGRAAIVLALADTGFGFLIGGLLGSLFGWDWRGIFFLGSIIVMSSLSVAAKSLIELRRLDNRETEFLLSAMVVEAFISMVLLTLSTSLIVVGGGGGPHEDVTQVAVAVATVYVALIAAAIFLVPRIARRMAGIRHEEVFILLALTMVFSAAALSWAFGLPFMIGAFFMGVAFSETTLTERLRIRLMSLRDAFTAAFFVGFGMLINLQLLLKGDVVLMVALAIPLIVFNEVVLTSTIGFFMGLGRREAVNLGTAFLGRAEDAILFASVGGRLKDEAGAPVLSHGTSLYPFAGGICLAMSILTPKLMKVSARMADALGRAMPRWLRFGGMLVQRTLAVELSPEEAARHGRSPGLLAATLALLVAALVLIGTFRYPDWRVRAALTAVALAIWAVHAWLTRRGLRVLGQSIDLTGLNVLSRDREALAGYVSSTISAIMLMGVLVAALFPMGPLMALLAPAAIIPVILFMSKRAYAAAVEPPVGMHAHEMLDNQMRADGLEAGRGRGGGRQ